MQASLAYCRSQELATAGESGNTSSLPGGLRKLNRLHIRCRVGSLIGNLAGLRGR